jgi:hypothetical protein
LGLLANAFFVWVFPGNRLGDFGLQVIENCVTTADRLQITLFEVEQITSQRGKLQFAIRKLRLEFGEACLFAFQFFVLR